MQWVGEEDWIYRCQFEVESLPREGEQADLKFDGLDTFATVSRESLSGEQGCHELTHRL